MDYLIRNTTLGLPAFMLFIAIVATGKTGNVVAILQKYGKNRKTAKCAIGLWHFTDLADFYAAGLYSDRSLSSEQRNWCFKDSYWPKCRFGSFAVNYRFGHLKEVKAVTD